jgi:hypothetical protein
LQCHGWWVLARSANPNNFILHFRLRPERSK